MGFILSQEVARLKVLTRADEHALDLVRDMPCLPPPLTPTFLLCALPCSPPSVCLCSLSPLLAGAAGFHLKDNYVLSGASQMMGTVPYPEELQFSVKG